MAITTNKNLTKTLKKKIQYVFINHRHVLKQHQESKIKTLNNTCIVYIICSNAIDFEWFNIICTELELGDRIFTLSKALYTARNSLYISQKIISEANLSATKIFYDFEVSPYKKRIIKLCVASSFMVSKNRNRNGVKNVVFKKQY